jgi:hypothetical protein
MAIKRAAVLLYGIGSYAIGVSSLVAWILYMLGVLPFLGVGLHLPTAAAVAFNRFDRHPIMSGALIGMWVAPTMQLDHLLFAATATVYIVMGGSVEAHRVFQRANQVVPTGRAGLSRRGGGGVVWP